MELKQNGTKVYNRYYLSNRYEIDDRNVGGVKEKLYLGGDYYTAPAVLVRYDSGDWQLYYIYRDYLGSITHIVNNQGTLVQEMSYGAWGRLRNPSTQTAYTPGSEPELTLGRGYTGHEYWPQFGLVNMNARLYDPAVGRFLSPDPYVQMPDFTQSFNRYSYALNNPLRYTDPDGEIIFTLMCAFIPGLQPFLPIGIAMDVAWMTEYGTQVANNYAMRNQGMAMSNSDIWFGNVDWFDVGVSAVAGGVAARFPVAAPFIKYGKPFVTNAVDIYGNGNIRSIFGGNMEDGRNGKISLEDYLLGCGLEIGTTILTDKVSQWLNKGSSNLPEYISKDTPVKDVLQKSGKEFLWEFGKNLSPKLIRGRIEVENYEEYRMYQEIGNKDYSPFYPVYKKQGEINLSNDISMDNLRLILSLSVK